MEGIFFQYLFLLTLSTRSCPEWAVGTSFSSISNNSFRSFFLLIFGEDLYLYLLYKYKKSGQDHRIAN